MVSNMKSSCEVLKSLPCLLTCLRSNSPILWTSFRCDWLIFPKRLGWQSSPNVIFVIIATRKKISITWAAFLIRSTTTLREWCLATERSFWMVQPLKENNYVFDFAQEILAYCRSDVDILRRCCLEFHELVCRITEIDQFEKCLTIASACKLVFRAFYME